MPRNTTKRTNGNAETTPVSKIVQAVRKAGGVTRTTLGELRDEMGQRRLGKTVLANMAEYLSNNGLGVYPSWVLSADNTEPRQWQEVYVYERDNSPRSAVLDAMSDPDPKALIDTLGVFSGEVKDYSGLSESQRMSLVKQILGA